MASLEELRDAFSASVAQLHREAGALAKVCTEHALELPEDVRLALWRQCVALDRMNELHRWLAEATATERRASKEASLN